MLISLSYEVHLENKETEFMKTIINNNYKSTLFPSKCKNAINNYLPLTNCMTSRSTVVGHMTVSTPSPNSTIFCLWSLNCLSPYHRMVKSNGYLLFNLYQLSLLLFCTPSTYCLFREQCVYSSICRNTFEYSFFLIPLVCKSKQS